MDVFVLCFFVVVFLSKATIKKTGLVTLAYVN